MHKWTLFMRLQAVAVLVFHFLLLFAISLVFPVVAVHAIIVEDYTIAEAPPTDLNDPDWDLNWDYVYHYKKSSGVAIAPNWLLTAAHVADDNEPSSIVSTIGTHIQQEILFHSPNHDPDHADKADLALVRFDPAFPGHYPLYNGAFPTNTADRLVTILVGFGRTGTVQTSFYNEISSGSGTKRWGSQKIDGLMTAGYNAGGFTGGTTNQGVYMTFSLGDTPYEAGVGVNDSGGGTFVKDDGVWKLAGINTARFGSSTNFTGQFAVSVPAYQAWISNAITPTADYDGDGIPNYWEQLYSDSQTGLVANVNSDGDGFTNLEEYLADTDPTDAASFLRLDVTAGEADLAAPSFTFNGSTGRVYRIMYSTNALIDPAVIWAPAHTNAIPGAGSETVISLTNMPPGAVYRLQVSLP